MIKLRSILDEVFEEVRIRESDSGTHQITMQFDGQFIPVLSRDTDVIEVSAEVYYDLDSGSPARGMFGRPEHSSPGEGASVELGNFDINDISIHHEDGKETNVDVRLLHPQQRRILEKLVEDYIERNARDIENTILNGWEAQ